MTEALKTIEGRHIHNAIILDTQVRTKRGAGIAFPIRCLDVFDDLSLLFSFALTEQCVERGKSGWCTQTKHEK